MSNQNSKISFLERILGKCKYSHNTKEAEFYCCFCFHHKKKLSVNIENDHWKCWVCGKAGKSLVFLLKKSGSSSDLAEYAKTHKAKNVFLKKDELVGNSFVLKLPDNFVPILEYKHTIFGQRALRYLERRGITERDILLNKIGIVTSGKFEDRIIFPSFDKFGNLNFYTGRAIGESPLKYLDPEVPKSYKKEIIINELNIDWNVGVTLVEGYIDMLKARNAIPLFGSLLSKDSAVFQAIVKNGAPVFLAGDADAVTKFQKIGNMFMDYNIDAYFIDVTPYKDVGEMSRLEFRERQMSATLLTKETIFRNKLAALCQ